MTNEGLFKDFNPIGTKAWKQKIQVDLKGADYNDTLVWKTSESINVKPFYNEDDIKDLDVSVSSNSEFNIGQVIYVHDVLKSNKNAITAFEKGANTVKFIVPNETISLNELFQTIESKDIQLELLFLSEAFIISNQAILKKENITLISDCISQLTTDGNWFHDYKTDIDLFKTTLRTTNAITVNAEIYQNAGAILHQELAYTLAHLSEYFNIIESNPELKTKYAYSLLSININIAIGSNYFFEIAKVKALRKIVESLSAAFNFKTNLSIHATPTRRNKTIYDYNTNMLRTTTECMSAVLGGATTVFNLAYDAIYHKTNEFGERISRNQLLILKHESYFNTVLNPSDGSYYIESLTHQLAEKSLELFKDIEANDGFLVQLKAGSIQKKIKESGQKEQAQFNQKEITLLGSNKFENKDDKMKHNLELYPFIKQNPRKTLLEPIIAKRLAESYEQERLNNE